MARQRLAQRAARATAWSGMESAGRAVLQFGITVVLARLLDPADFGLVALVLLFVAVCYVVADLGLSSYLVRQPNVSEDEKATMFFANLAVGIACAGLLIAAAPLLAGFFGIPEFQGIAGLLALSMLVGTVGSVHAALMTRELDFRKLALVGLASLALSGLLGVLLALSGSGAWSLAWQALAQSIVTTTLLWIVHPWRPRGRFSRALLREMLRFGAPWMLARLVDAGYSRLHAAFIARLFDARDLGFYDRARSTQQLPSNLLTGTVNRIAFPAFSQAAADAPNLRRVLPAGIRATMLVYTPVLLGMAAMAQPLIELVYGARWLPAAPLFRILCLAGLLWPLHALNVSVLMAMGHSRAVLAMELPKKAVAILLLCVASLHGLEAIAWSQVAASVFSFLVNAHCAGRMLGPGILEQARVVARSALAGALMFFAVLMVDAVIGTALPVNRLLVAVGVGVPVYSLACLLFREHLLLAWVRARSVTALLDAALATSRRSP